MTTETERCPQCDDNNRCGHEWHGTDEWAHQAATVIRGLKAELDAARAREAKLREALKALIAYARELTIFTDTDGVSYDDDEPEIAAAVAALAEGE